MAFEQLWAECERLQAEVDSLREQLKTAKVDADHEEGLRYLALMEITTLRARLSILLSERALLSRGHNYERNCAEI